VEKYRNPQATEGESILNAGLKRRNYGTIVQHTFSLKINPCSDNFLTLILEGGRRMLAQSINKKEPITKEILLNIVQLYAEDASKSYLNKG
jgi:hypothetical protein